jgi:hypothetical protein
VWGLASSGAGASVTFGINNVFDAAPPFADNFQGYDAQTASPIGRFFYVELEKKNLPIGLAVCPIGRFFYVELEKKF